MSHELHYTSAARGLKLGSQGFCTVAATANLPGPVADRLEGLSGFRALYPPGDPSDRLNPAAVSHVRIDVAGHVLNVISRVAAAGLDYSGRGNKYAHHVAISAADRPAGGPAWLAMQPGFLAESWSGEPRTLAAGRAVPRGDRPASICREWGRWFGDSGWAGVVAESFLADPDRPVYVVFDPGQDVLPLFAEALALVPRDRRWAVSFTTYDSGQLQNVAFAWRGVVRDSSEARQALRQPSALILDAAGLPGRPVGGGLVEQARTGIAPPPEARPSPVAAASPRPVASPRPRAVPVPGLAQEPEPEPEARPDHAARYRLPGQPRPIPPTTPAPADRRLYAWLWGGVAASLLLMGGMYAYLRGAEKATARELATQIDLLIAKNELDRPRTLLDAATRSRQSLARDPAIVAATTRLVAAETLAHAMTTEAEKLGGLIDQVRLDEAKADLDEFLRAHPTLTSHPWADDMNARIALSRKDDLARVKRFNEQIAQADQAASEHGPPPGLEGAREKARTPEERAQVAAVERKHREAVEKIDAENRARFEAAARRIEEDPFYSENTRPIPRPVDDNQRRRLRELLRVLEKRRAALQRQRGEGPPPVASIGGPPPSDPVRGRVGMPMLQFFPLPDRQVGVLGEGGDTSRSIVVPGGSPVEKLIVRGLNDYGGNPKGQLVVTKTGDAACEVRFRPAGREDLVLGTFDWKDGPIVFQTQRISDEFREAYRHLSACVLEVALKEQGAEPQYFLLGEEPTGSRKVRLEFDRAEDIKKTMVFAPVELRMPGRKPALKPSLGNCQLSSAGKWEVEIPMDRKQDRRQIVAQLDIPDVRGLKLKADIKLDEIDKVDKLGTVVGKVDAILVSIQGWPMEDWRVVFAALPKGERENQKHPQSKAARLLQYTGEKLKQVPKGDKPPDAPKTPPGPEAPPILPTDPSQDPALWIARLKRVAAVADLLLNLEAEIQLCVWVDGKPYLLPPAAK